ncbi:MAG: MerR family transcriptional regulator, partial [Planctomycetaceae bacterium]
MIVAGKRWGYSAGIEAGILDAVNEFASVAPAHGPQSAAALASLAGQRIAFTGTLASMTHRQAQQVVEEHGGQPTEHVGKATTLLVVGEEGWPLEADGRPSVKLVQAQKLRAEGVELRIVSESDWLGFVGLDDRRSQLDQVYTPAMLSQLLGVSVHQVRRWERLGLVRAVRRVHRLPFFDLREVASAQRLAQLLASGVAPDKVRDSLCRLEQVVGDPRGALAQLELLSRAGDLAFRDRQGRLTTVRGQRLIEFEPPAGAAPPAPGTHPAGPATTSPSPPTTQPCLPTVSREQWGRIEWYEEGQRL